MPVPLSAPACSQVDESSVCDIPGPLSRFVRIGDFIGVVAGARGEPRSRRQPRLKVELEADADFA